MPSPPTKTRRRRPAQQEPADLQVHVDSPTLEILGALDVHNSIAGFEARLDSLEIDLARQAGSREDDARRIAGELAVMKARVEDALDAFAGTADELRAMAKDVDTKAKAKRGGATADLNAIRTELEAKIDGATAGVGDVLQAVSAELSERIAAVGEQLDAVASTMQSLASLPDRLAAVEAALAERG